MKFLRDPIWQFIGVLVALISILIVLAFANLLIAGIFFIIAIILLVLLFSRIRPTKTLYFRLLSDTIVLSIQEEEEINADLQVLYKGEEVKGDLHLVILRLWNASSDPILAEDYKNSIRMNFGKEAKVLSVQVSDSQPQTIKEEIDDKQSIKPDAGKVVLEPMWLNTDNSLTLKVLLTSFEGSVYTDETRIIVGGFVRNWDKTFNKKIKIVVDFLLNDNNQSTTFGFASALLSFLTTTGLILILLNILNLYFKDINSDIFVPIIGISYFVLLIILFNVFNIFLFKKYILKWLSHIYD